MNEKGDYVRGFGGGGGVHFLGTLNFAVVLRLCMYAAATTTTTTIAATITRKT